MKYRLYYLITISLGIIVPLLNAHDINQSSPISTISTPQSAPYIILTAEHDTVGDDGFVNLFVTFSNPSSEKVSIPYAYETKYGFYELCHTLNEEVLEHTGKVRGDGFSSRHINDQPFVYLNPSESISYKMRWYSPPDFKGKVKLSYDFDTTDFDEAVIVLNVK